MTYLERQQRYKMGQQVGDIENVQQGQACGAL